MPAVSDITVVASDRGAGEFDVEVESGGRRSSYRVTVPPALSERLGDPDPATLVRESFAFLLEREPPSSILARFSLDVIGRYFPDYEREIRTRLP